VRAQGITGLVTEWVAAAEIQAALLGPGSLGAGLVVQVYRHLQDALLVLSLQSLVNPTTPSTLDLVGVITGASQAVNIFDAPGSALEGEGFALAHPSRNDVYLIGPNQASAIQTFLNNLPPAQNLTDFWALFEGTLSALPGGAHQPPSQVNPIQGCLRDPFSDTCRQLVYDAGFASVATCSGICPPVQVLILVCNMDDGT
jgi:hypothetical protein